MFLRYCYVSVSLRTVFLRVRGQEEVGRGRVVRLLPPGRPASQSQQQRVICDSTYESWREAGLGEHRVHCREHRGDSANESCGERGRVALSRNPKIPRFARWRVAPPPPRPPRASASGRVTGFGGGGGAAAESHRKVRKGQRRGRRRASEFLGFLGHSAAREAAASGGFPFSGHRWGNDGGVPAPARLYSLATVTQ